MVLGGNIKNLIMEILQFCKGEIGAIKLGKNILVVILGCTHMLQDCLINPICRLALFLVTNIKTP
jgi:hypothetical protein